jgi:hypothetical protein
MPGGSSSDRPAKRPGPITDNSAIRRAQRKRTGVAVSGGVAVTGCYDGSLVVARPSMVAGRAIRRSSTAVDQRVERHAVVPGVQPTLAGLHRGAAAALVVLTGEVNGAAAPDGWHAMPWLNVSDRPSARCRSPSQRSAVAALHQPRRVEPVQRSRRNCQLDHMSSGRGEVQLAPIH